MSAQTAVAARDAVAGEIVKRSWKAPIAFALFGVIAFVFFGIRGESGELRSTFRLSTADDAWQIDPVSVPSEAAAIVLSVLCLAVAAYAAWLVYQYRSVPGWLVAFYVVTFVLAFLIWAVAGADISFTSLLQGSLALSVPLIYGAMSGILCERSGVINIAIEGQLLFGAFLASAVASTTGSQTAGIVAAVVAGVIVAWVLAVFAIKYIVNQIIVGVVLNVLVLGITNFFFSQLLDPDSEKWNSPGVLPRIDIPGLSEIPVVGPVLFRQTIIVYLMYVTVIAIHVAMFKSRWGLRVRSVGEHPKAADTLGINVNRTRFRNVLLGGAAAGLGGAFLVFNNATFRQDISAGQGFIALAAMIVGRYTPFGALGAALLFGFATNLESILSLVGRSIPTEFMLMLPYVVTVVAVAGLVGRVRVPAADGQPYVKS